MTRIGSHHCIFSLQSAINWDWEPQKAKDYLQVWETTQCVLYMEERQSSAVLSSDHSPCCSFVCYFLPAHQISHLQPQLLKNQWWHSHSSSETVLQHIHLYWCLQVPEFINNLSVTQLLSWSQQWLGTQLGHQEYVTFSAFTDGAWGSISEITESKHPKESMNKSY